VGIDEIGPVIVSMFWEDIDQSDAWFEKKTQFTAFVRTAKVCFFLPSFHLSLQT
jgi:hypothetical protein